MPIPNGVCDWIVTALIAFVALSIVSLRMKLARERDEHNACITSNVILKSRNERLTREIEQFMAEPAFQSIDRSCIRYGRDIAGGNDVLRT